DIFPGRAWIAAELFARSGDRARLASLQTLARTVGLPLVAAGGRPTRGPRPHARARPARAAGHADGDPPAHAALRMRLRAVSEWRTPSALARAACLALSTRTERRPARFCGALIVLAGRAALRIPGGIGAGGCYAGKSSARTGGGGIGAAVWA